MKRNLRDKNNKYKLIAVVLLLVVILEGLVIILTRPREIPKAPVRPKARIAIVIDDWGYNLNNLGIIAGIKYPLTLSVLPNLPYSARVSEELHSLGFEIILHLPMEPRRTSREQFRLEKDTINVSLTGQETRDIINSDLDSIVYAKGVSNHMGSLATEDYRTMETVFKELKKKNLYFLDSYVSPQSICLRLARRLGVRSAKRDIFLDNNEDAAYIRGQLAKLKARARNYGLAIGIGHDRKATLEALREMMPKIEKEGYSFVFLSELVR